MSAVLVQARRSRATVTVDPWLLGAVVALICLGVVMVGSSSMAIAELHGRPSFHYLGRHLMFLVAGGVMMLCLLRLPLRRVEQLSPMLLPLAFLLLLSVFVPGLGHTVNGSTRWIHLGITGFQVAEAVKLLMVLYLAGYLVRHQERVARQFSATFKPLAIAGLLVLLLLLQPDYGAAVLLLAITLGMLWLGGSRLRDLGLLTALVVPAMALAAVLEPYRLRRLFSFMNPWERPFDEGFQLTQALIAIGRGEWFGVGLGASVQKLFYLPEAHTDFILAVLAEELGLFGVVLVLGLFSLLVMRLMAIGAAAHARGRAFGALLAFGVAIWLALQSLISIGVNMGVLPTKGLTLPLISSGGSSVLATCVALGLCLRLSLELRAAESGDDGERPDD